MDEELYEMVRSNNYGGHICITIKSYENGDFIINIFPDDLFEYNNIDTGLHNEFIIEIIEKKIKENFNNFIIHFNSPMYLFEKLRWDLYLIYFEKLSEDLKKNRLI